MANVPIAVLIPTYNRGAAVLSVLEKIQACDPQPSEIWVHVDQADGMLEPGSDFEVSGGQSIDIIRPVRPGWWATPVLVGMHYPLCCEFR